MKAAGSYRKLGEWKSEICITKKNGIASDTDDMVEVGMK
jgi:hypothetical protein